MPDFTGHTTHASPFAAAGHQPKGVGSSAEKKTRTHARGHHPQTRVTRADNIPSSRSSTLQEPNIDKDLPDPPSASTQLWGSGPVLEVLRNEVVRPPTERFAEVINDPTSLSGSIIGSLAGSWIDFTTCSEFSNQQAIVVPDDSNGQRCPSKDTSLETSSFLTVTPIIRRCSTMENLASVSSGAKRVPNTVGQDGQFRCLRRGCGGVFSTRAYDHHAHIHLIHDRLTLCESCGTRFIDDDHKQEHLNSCSELPTFDEIESFNAESEHVGPFQALLGLFSGASHP